MKLALAAASSFLMATAVPFAASADDVLSPDGLVQAIGDDPQENVEWVYVGCAAYPVNTETKSDGSMVAQQSKSRINPADRSAVLNNKSVAPTD